MTETVFVVSHDSVCKLGGLSGLGWAGSAMAGWSRMVSTSGSGIGTISARVTGANSTPGRLAYTHSHGHDPGFSNRRTSLNSQKFYNEISMIL